MTEICGFFKPTLHISIKKITLFLTCVSLARISTEWEKLAVSLLLIPIKSLFGAVALVGDYWLDCLVLHTLLHLTGKLGGSHLISLEVKVVRARQTEGVAGHPRRHLILNNWANDPVCLLGLRKHKTIQHGLSNVRYFLILIALECERKRTLFFECQIINLARPTIVVIARLRLLL